MKEYKPEVIECHGLEDTIMRIGLTAEKLIKKAETAEEKAFLLGHINAAAALISGKIAGGHCLINFEYKEILDAWNKTEKEADKESEPKYHQVSIDEFLTDIKKALIQEIKKDLRKKSKKE